MIAAKIIDIDVKDIRFPTSLRNLGSDAMHTKSDHSCVYVIIETDKGYKGYGISSTLGKGNALVVQMCKVLSELIKNRTTIEIFTNFASFWRILTSDTQLRWLGPENGVIHLATAAIVNALWDLWARIEDKPVWKLLTDMTPEQLVSTIDFRYIRDILTEQDAIEMLKKNQLHQQKCEKELREKGYPAYTADVGCWGYSPRQIKDYCKKYVKLEFDMFKICVTHSQKENRSICHALRDEIGWKRKLLLDANQIWEITDIHHNKKLFQEIEPFCIEEPTSPDDPIMYNKICSVLKKEVKVSAGKACANRVMFKQFKRAARVDFWYVNVARLGGVNEALAIYFMARVKGSGDKYKYSTPPIWAYTGGIGLGEMAQHLQMWDYICLSQTFDDRSIEFVRHQHGYFENPIFIKNARYMPPTRPGFSTKLKDKCIARWSYPEGTRWKPLFKTGHFVKETNEH